MDQRHGSADPDPDPPQNIMDPQHCLQHTVFRAFSVNLPLAELSGIQKDLVGLGAIHVHNETHSAGISEWTKTNNLTFEKFI